MRRGTNTTFYFSIPYSKDDIKVMWVTFAQDGGLMITKKKEDVDFVENTTSQSNTNDDNKENYVSNETQNETQSIFVSLNQNETLRFVAKTKFGKTPLGRVQVKLLTNNGMVWVSKIHTFDIEDVLNEEEIKEV